MANIHVYIYLFKLDCSHDLFGAFCFVSVTGAGSTLAPSLRRCDARLETVGHGFLRFFEASSLHSLYFFLKFFYRRGGAKGWEEI